MTFNPVLMQMQPRELAIPIETNRANINIPKVWFRAFTEPQVCEQMNKFVRETNYSHYLINSDDAILYKRAVDTVLQNAPKCDIFTAWVNMHMNGEEMSIISNVATSRLPIIDQDRWPEKEDFPEYLTIDEVLNKPNNFEVCVVCFCISSFKRNILLEYPLQTYRNTNASDHHISYRIQRDGKYKIWTHRDAFCRHLRQGWSPLKHKWLVGNETPNIIYELEPKQYSTEGKKQKYLYEPLFVKGMK